MEFNEKERSLHAEGKALIAQAKALRVQREEKARRDEEAERKAKAVLADAQAKTERDERIRRALLAVAECVKKEGLAFDAPWGFYGTTPKQKAFTLIDKRKGGKIEISTHPTGFSWD